MKYHIIILKFFLIYNFYLCLSNNQQKNQHIVKDNTSKGKFTWQTDKKLQFALLFFYFQWKWCCLVLFYLAKQNRMKPKTSQAQLMKSFNGLHSLHKLLNPSLSSFTQCKFLSKTLVLFYGWCLKLHLFWFQEKFELHFLQPLHE